MKKAAIVMGSDSDLGKVKSAALTLKELGIPFEMRIISAHRTPAEAADFAQNAEKNGFGVLIAAAGKAAHLAGALAANTVLPVIGLPISSSTLDGLDALLSPVQTGMQVLAFRRFHCSVYIHGIMSSIHARLYFSIRRAKRIASSTQTWPK